MIWFWIVAGLLTLAALAVLLRPLVRRAGRGVAQGESVVAVFRRQHAAGDLGARRSGLVRSESALRQLSVDVR